MTQELIYQKSLENVNSRKNKYHIYNKAYKKKRDKK